MKMKDFFKKYKLFFGVFFGIAAIVLYLFYNALKPIKVLPVYQPAMVNYELVDSTLQHIKKLHQIAPFRLTNQNGKIITQRDYQDKIYVADFFFTSCPGICPKLTKNMGVVQERYKNDNDVLLLSHTVMPWTDSIPVLNAYAKRNNINDKKWNLVTGNKNKLYSIARDGYFADEDFVKTKDVSQFIHTENFILVDGQGFIRGVFNGTIPMDIKRLIRHIEILKKEEIIIH